MTHNNKGLISLFTVLFTVTIFFSCSRDNDEKVEATYPAIGEVFIDNFSAGLQYAVFEGAVPSAFEVVTDVTYEGDAAMRFAVPDVGNPEGSYAGGAFFVGGGRDLSGFNALTFWVRASKASTLDVVGFGVDLGENKYEASLSSVPMNTNWRKVIIPIPNPDVLTLEKGMFYYSEGPEDGRGYTFWIDEVQFENLGTIAKVGPEMFGGEDVTITSETGDNPPIQDLVAVFNLPSGQNISVNASPAYYTFNSSNPTVATVSADGVISVMDAGETVITGSLGNDPINGSLTIQSTGAPVAPQVSAPTPDEEAANVTSIFSNVYNNEPVEFFNGFWQGSTTLSQDYQVGNDDMIRYTMLNFVGIQFTMPTIDVTNRNWFHIDLWTPDATEPASDFKILLFDVGADGAFGTSDDSGHELTITNPTLVTEDWISLDIPLSDFVGLTNRNNLAQVVLSSATISNVYVDNIYFYQGEGGGGGDPVPPTEPAPTPTISSENVISIYSDAYTNVPNQGFNLYGGAAFEEADISGDKALRYTQGGGDGGNFQVIELGGDQINADAAGMTNFRFDLWFPNDVGAGTNFLLKVVDIPGGGPTEALIFTADISNPAMAQGAWLSYDFTLSELQALGLGGTANIQQVVIDLINAGDVYIDNILFYKDDGGGGGGFVDPTNPAPMPMEAAEDVISIYSDAYTNVPNQGFANYGAAAFEEVNISGDNSLKYTFFDGDGGNFQVIELGGDQINAEVAGMTNFRFDLWFPNEVTIESNLLLKLVDIPGGGPTEALIFVNDMSDPSISQGAWLSFDIPFADLAAAGLGGTANIQQVVVDLMNAGAVYIDNIYFYKDGNGGGGGTVEPTSPAPMPMEAPGDVISIYSDAYTNVPNQGFANYGAAAFEEVNISGDNSLKYTFVEGGGGNFQVIELGGDQINAEAAGMTNFRFDLWFPNEVTMESNFLLKLVDIPGSGPTEALIFVNDMSDPSMSQGAWISFDISFSDLAAAGIGGTANIQQVVIDLMNAGAVYIDNIYFYNNGSGGGGGGSMAPTSPAPMPTEASENVISIYSNAYSNVPNQGFANYGAAAFEEVNISGDNSLKYTFVEGGGGNFQVIELGGDQINAEAAGMTNFRFDIWFPNEITMESNFLLKLVDIPGSGPTEALIFINDMSNPSISQGAWLSFDIPFADLMAAGIGGTANIQQVVIDLMNAGEIYLDNIYFYKDGNGGGGGSMAPDMAAPTPTQDAANVISIYSDAYSNVPNQGFANYGSAGFEEVSVTGNNALKYTFADVGGGNFQVIELGGGQINAEAAGMTNFRFDLWFPNEVTAESNFLLKLVDIPGAVTEALIFVNPGTDPAMSQGSWISFDIPFTELETLGLGGKANIQQVVVDLMNAGEVYIDNIYLYK